MNKKDTDTDTDTLSPRYNASLYYSKKIPSPQKKTIQKTLERNHVKKSITSYIIGYQNSSKKLESLDQSGILLCHTPL